MLLAIGLIHWLADFVLQTHWQASNKAESVLALSKHVATYSLVILMFCFLELDIPTSFAFAIITFILHWCTDAVTSNIVKRCFDDKDFHNGFVVIGFDQILHYAQLLLTYNYLTTT